MIFEMRRTDMVEHLDYEVSAYTPWHGCWNVGKVEIFNICFVFMLYEVLFLLYVYYIFIIYLYVYYMFFDFVICFYFHIIWF